MSSSQTIDQTALLLSTFCVAKIDLRTASYCWFCTVLSSCYFFGRLKTSIKTQSY